MANPANGDVERLNKADRTEMLDCYVVCDLEKVRDMMANLPRRKNNRVLR